VRAGSAAGFGASDEGYGHIAGRDSVVVAQSAGGFLQVLRACYDLVISYFETVPVRAYSQQDPIYLKRRLGQCQNAVDVALDFNPCANCINHGSASCRFGIRTAQVGLIVGINMRRHRGCLFAPRFAWQVFRLPVLKRISVPWHWQLEPVCIRFVRRARAHENDSERERDGREGRVKERERKKGGGGILYSDLVVIVPLVCREPEIAPELGDVGERATEYVA